MTRELDFWDLAYRDGDHLEHWEPLEIPTELVEALESGLVRKGQTALDIGCGAGCEAVFLAARGVAVIGVDASPVALDRGSFHIISRRLRRRYANEVARVLRPGGTLLLRGARDDDDEAGMIGFGRREIERLFVPRGFESGPLSPLTFSARPGELQGAMVVWTR